MMHDFFAEHPLLLAPMAGVTDEAFRALCREQGASLAYTEMVSAKGLSFARRATCCTWLLERTSSLCSCSDTSLP